MNLRKYKAYLILVLVGFSGFMVGSRSKNGFIQFLSKLNNTTKESIQKTNPYRTVNAHVRFGNEICLQEKEFLAKRATYVQDALHSLLGVSVARDRVPKISLIASGGGLRAKLFATGVISALAQTGLLDTITHISALSGSTWAVSLLYTHNLSIAQWKELVIQKALKNRMPQGQELYLMLEALQAKHLFDKQMTLVDFYGALIANSFFDDFGDQRHKKYLSKQAEKIAEGQMPLPIYTAVALDGQGKYRWMEFTPYEVGISWLSLYIPTWSYGRKFIQGTSVDHAPEHGLGFLLGLYGAAFGAPFEKVYHEGIKPTASPNTQKLFEQYMLKWFGNKRLATGSVYNFTYGIKTSPLCQDEYLKVIDAGVDFNLPYAPISNERLGRASDILIFADASQELDGGWHLKHVEYYAKEHQLKFPSIDYRDIDTRAISVFKDEKDLACPIVIYISRLFDKNLWESEKHNPAFKEYEPYYDQVELVSQPTIATTYTEFDARQLVALGEMHVKAALPTILDAIYTKVR